jgi:hypothetical protein
MPYELEPAEIEEINSKLPPQFAALKDKYPQTISNIATHWELPPYPPGYIPEDIDIYYEDDNFIDSAIAIENGHLTSVLLEDSVTDPSLIYMAIENDPAYVQIEGKVIFNRLGGAVLPKVAINLEFMLRSILNGISH